MKNQQDKPKRYLECEKMAAVRDQSQTIGGFLEWLQDEKHLFICNRENEEYWPIHSRIEQWLADYFDINLNKVEEEKCKMLYDLRRKQ
ncbi:hypothetical protein LCGC14_0142360 [marine sediment metagenome]|uniref:Uncharacterized protein n=1 Tax=marine sediment metagenome TaxID=412755 RepID=A0A0F9XIG1_9ZZZZ